MTHLKYILLSFLLVTFVGVADAFASVQHHHEGHDHAVESPFDKKQEGRSLHCLLNNHQHNGGFCPHSSLPKGDGESHQLSADCGGKAPGSLPSYSFHKDSIADFSSIVDLTNNSFNLISGKISATQQDLSSQDPPPEVL